MGTKNQPAPYDCYKNAEMDEPMFVLLARDPGAPQAIYEWIRIRKSLIDFGFKPKSDLAMLDEALACADAMVQWRAKHRGDAVGPLQPAGMMAVSEDLRVDPEAAP